jgi:hypothetical protein
VESGLTQAVLGGGIQSMSDLADFLLGLKKSEASEIATNEIRWNIPLQAHPPGDGEIHIKPAMLSPPCCSASRKAESCFPTRSKA